MAVLEVMATVDTIALGKITLRERYIKMNGFDKEIYKLAAQFMRSHPSQDKMIRPEGDFYISDLLENAITNIELLEKVEVTPAVYLAYECYNDYCNIWKHVVGVFSNKADAARWVKNEKETKNEWREWEEVRINHLPKD